MKDHENKHQIEDLDVYPEPKRTEVADVNRKVSRGRRQPEPSSTGLQLGKNIEQNEAIGHNLEPEVRRDSVGDLEDDDLGDQNSEDIDFEADLDEADLDAVDLCKDDFDEDNFDGDDLYEDDFDEGDFDAEASDVDVSGKTLMTEVHDIEKTTTMLVKNETINCCTVSKPDGLPNSLIETILQYIQPQI
jgi:uncharacterized protein YjbI with pentapeptide repeats